MVSRILIKLVDEAVLPAILLIFARISSILLISKYLAVNYAVGSFGFKFDNAQDYVMVNSYSTLTIIAILAVGLLYILLKSWFFHDTHIPPPLTAKTYAYGLSYFIQTSFDLYSQGTIWLSYTYLLFFASGILAFFGLLYFWVFLVALVLTMATTILFIFDIEKEIAATKEKPEILSYGDADD